MKIVRSRLIVLGARWEMVRLYNGWMQVRGTGMRADKELQPIGKPVTVTIAPLAAKRRAVDIVRVGKRVVGGVVWIRAALVLYGVTEPVHVVIVRTGVF